MSNIFYDKRISLTLYKLEKLQDAEGIGAWVASPNVKDSTEVSTGKVWSRVYMNYTPVINIECTDSGPKPDISLSFEAVPGHSVVKCNVAITNLQLDTLDIRDIALMKIVAGYGTDNICELNVDVFSAWCESPNPDGVTRIQGIATEGSLGMFFGPRSYQLQFYCDEHPITMDVLLNSLLNNDLCIRIPNFEQDVKASFLDKELTLSDGTMKRIGDFTFTITSSVVRATSGYQVVQWLGRELYNWGRSINKYIYVTIFNNTVKIICSGTEDKSTEQAIPITAINSAAYTGGLLTLKGPWHPKVVPGALIHVPIQFYSMENMYQTIDRNIYNDPESNDMYRVISMSVNFDTNGSNNTMSITALQKTGAENPWDNNVLNSYLNGNESSAESLSESAKTTFLKNYNIETSVVIGYNKAKTSQKTSFWNKILSLDIPSKVQVVNLYDIKEVNEQEYVFNGANWSELFEAYNTVGYPYIRKDENDVKVASVPVLSPADKQKILTYSDITLSAANKSRLKSLNYLALNPKCLWVIYPAVAYYYSYKNNTPLYKVMKDTGALGSLITNGITNEITENCESLKQVNGFLEESVQQLDNVSVKTTTYQLDGEKVPTLIASIPAGTVVHDLYAGADIQSGGLQDWVSTYKNYAPIIKVILESSDITISEGDRNELELWYYMLYKEGNFE